MHRKGIKMNMKFRIENNDTISFTKIANKKPVQRNTGHIL